MEQHPVPQQISSYQFRLVGDMTLKQFFQLGGGALIALIIYSTNLIGFVKWPLIIFFSLSGAALAFLPFEGRPLEKWIIAFFKSVYSPTLYFWKRAEKPPVFFAQSLTAQQKASEQKLKTPQTVPPVLPETRAAITLEQQEQSFFQRMGHLFSAPAQVPQPTPPPKQKPELHIPEDLPTPFTPQERRDKIIQPKKQVVTQPIKPTSTTHVAPTITPRPSTVDHAAQFSPEAAPPNPPTQPNIVVGQIMDPQGNIVEAAILEIRDEVGRPVRALKTNKVGHFLIVTPLPNGKYKIITEKEGYQFVPINIEVKGEIVAPIAIRAKPIINNGEGIRNYGQVQQGTQQQTS